MSAPRKKQPSDSVKRPGTFIEYACSANSTGSTVMLSCDLVRVRTEKIPENKFVWCFSAAVNCSGLGTYELLVSEKSKRVGCGLLRSSDSKASRYSPDQIRSISRSRSPSALASKTKALFFSVVAEMKNCVKKLTARLFASASLKRLSTSAPVLRLGRPRAPIATRPISLKCEFQCSPLMKAFCSAGCRAFAHGQSKRASAHISLKPGVPH
jgi:hypothetical protein